MKGQNKSLRELIETDSGITFLMRQLVADTENSFSDDEMFNVFQVLIMQSEIQEEILSRIPDKHLDGGTP